MNVDGRLVLVTGASSGIGAATARAFARKGARVLLLARTRSALDAVAAGIVAEGGEAHVYAVDVSDATAVAEVARAIRRDHGTPDVVINNAGAGRWLFVEETSPEEAVEMMAVPYFAAFYVTRAFLGAMRERASGRVINVTSPAAFAAWPGATGYTVARWAMRGFSEALRADLHGTGVGVTLVTPAAVRSPYFEHNPATAERMPRIARLFGSLSPEEVADGIVRAAERDRRQVFLPFRTRLGVLAHRWFPRLVDWLLIRTGWNRAPLEPA
ncbi:MAG: SDR family NAD(P)-dependent oxidoreductase [Gemmatimonadaceae bacterium]